MTAKQFTNMLSMEIEHIDTRCTEIDEATKALEIEREALEERRTMIESVNALYETSQAKINDALETQIRLYPLSQYEEEAQDTDQSDGHDVYAGDGNEDSKPALKSVS